MNDFPVFNPVMAHQLIAEGFKYVDKAVNRKKPEYFVYYFEKSNGIEDRVEEIVRELKK